MESILTQIQPLYDKLNSKYSTSYLIGSSWYKGEILVDWWKKCNKIYSYEYNVRVVKHILNIILINEGHHTDFGFERNTLCHPNTESNENKSLCLK